MPWELTSIMAMLPAFAIIMFRVVGLFLTAPLFSSSVLPIRIRAAMMMMIAVIIFPVMMANVPAARGVGEIVVGGMRELMIGAVMGLAVSAFLATADLAGLMIGQQAGIALGEVVDPTQNNRSSIVGQIYAIALMTVFLLLGGHRAMITALLDTYRMVPVFGFRPDESTLLLLVEMLSASFILAVRIAAPVLIALFLSGVAMAFLSRTMPQLNILTVGFGVRGLVATGTAGLALATCEELFSTALFQAIDAVRESLGLMEAMSRGGT